MLIANTYCGGIDLYHGVPDLKGAMITDMLPIENKDYYETQLELTRVNGEKFIIVIKQER